MALPVNVGIIDSNVRKFLAVPLLVLTATGAIAYHAYAFAAATALLGAYSFASGVVRISLMYGLLRISTIGGLHRLKRSSASPRAHTA